MATISSSSLGVDYVWQEEDLPESISGKFYAIEQHADTAILNELSAAGDALEQLAWKIGWLTDKLYRNLIANKQDVDYLFVCHFVAVTCLKNQRSMNTVKRWALTARFFTPKLAKQYNYDVLPMSHFAYAASFGDLKIKGTLVWQSVLDYSWNEYISSPVQKMPSVNELKNYFEAKRLPQQKKNGAEMDTDYVPSAATAIEDVPMSEVPTPNNLIGVTVDILLPIVKGAIDNFILGINGYIPVLQRHKPDVAKALAGVLYNLETIVSKMMEE